MKPNMLDILTDSFTSQSQVSPGHIFLVRTRPNRAGFRNPLQNPDYPDSVHSEAMLHFEEGCKNLDLNNMADAYNHAVRLHEIAPDWLRGRCLHYLTYARSGGQDDHAGRKAMLLDTIADADRSIAGLAKPEQTTSQPSNENWLVEKGKAILNLADEYWEDWRRNTDNLEALRLSRTYLASGRSTLSDCECIPPSVIAYTFIHEAIASFYLSEIERSKEEVQVASSLDATFTHSHINSRPDLDPLKDYLES